MLAFSNLSIVVICCQSVGAIAWLNPRSNKKAARLGGWLRSACGSPSTWSGRCRPNPQPPLAKQERKGNDKDSKHAHLSERGEQRRWRYVNKPQEIHRFPMPRSFLSLSPNTP